MISVEIPNKLLMALILLVLSLLTLPAVLGDGCCVPEQPDANAELFCYSEDQHASLFEGAMSSSLCRGDQFTDHTWSEGKNCDTDFPECVEGCCCYESATGETVGIYTTAVACLTDSEQAISFHSNAASTTNNCNNYCKGISPETYEVNGTVKNTSDEPVVGANVTVDFPGGQWNVTNATGGFSFQIMSSTNRHIFFINASWCEQTEDYSITGDVDLEIILDCSTDEEKPDTCPDPVWEYGFDDGEDRCGVPYDYAEDIQDYDDSPECSYQEWQGPLPFKSCPPSPACDNDGILDEGEACDGGVFRDGGSCQDYGYSFGSVSCRDCEVILTGCERCPAEADACTSAQCKECPICQEAEVCQARACLDEQPYGVAATTQTGKSSILVTWRFNDACIAHVPRFHVDVCTPPPTQSSAEWCSDNDAYDEVTIAKTDLSSSQPFSHPYSGSDGLDGRTTYCFNVSANIEEEGEQATTSAEAGWVCATTGDQYCMEGLHEDEFCAHAITKLKDYPHIKPNSRLLCNPANQIILLEDCLLAQCVDDVAGTTICKTNEQCRLCNGLFNMYGYYHFYDDDKDLIVPFLSGGTEIDLSCENKNIYQQNPSPDTRPACYDERTKTVADYLDECNEVQTCYDYHTKQACEDNPCRKPFLQGNCTWRPLLDEEGNSLGDQFGLGVCAPDDVALAECDRCQSDDTTLPACTEELCSLYAPVTEGVPGCYYLQDDKRCVRSDEVSCTNYTRRRECVGDENTPVQVNATYSEEDRINGGHNVTQRSKDVLSIGLCEWVDIGTDAMCVKNADNHTFSSKGLPSSDCDDVATEDKTTCLLDFEPPVTELFLATAAEQEWHEEDYPVYSFERPFNYDVKDNAFALSKLRTWFGFGTGTPYPIHTLEQLKSQTAEKDGTFNITYYSADPAKNLEQVKNATIIMDNTPPTFVEHDFTNTTAGFLVAEDEWRSNLTINYSFTDDHGPIRCNGTLLSTTSTRFPGNRFLSFKSGTVVQQNYTYLQDDQYLFRMNCSDHPFLSNTVINESWFVLEADSSITDPQPVRKKFSVDDFPLTINITTNRSASCWFNGSSTQFLDSATGTEHNYTFDQPLPHGLYFFNVSCEFEDGKVTKNNPSDTIWFSVDNESPTAGIIDVEERQPYDGWPYREDLTITFECDDNDSSLVRTVVDAAGHTEDLWDGNFDDSTVQWCRDDNETDRECYFDEWDGPYLAFSADDDFDDNERWLHYRCTDAGGNVGTTETQYLFVRNLQVKVAGVKIITPDRTEYLPDPLVPPVTH
ncbi:carboxypeptidase regulatory-like domain-containing protein [Candidatus Woesearchaeota archaeon]|nr:carboxypeptidase regulatory-like domain-containing protein [Candidatus Woesearchaeota archaeon]